MSPFTVDRRVFKFSILTVIALVATSAALADGNDKAVDDLANKAQIALSSGKPDEAISILRRAIDAAPNRADLYLLRSRARDSAGKFDGALEDATRYIELKPEEPYGYLSRARVYMSMEKHALALADANKAISLAPGESDGYLRRADIYADMGKESEAKADEAKAEEIDRRAAVR